MQENSGQLNEIKKEIQESTSFQDERKDQKMAFGEGHADKKHILILYAVRRHLMTFKIFY